MCEIASSLDNSFGKFECSAAEVRTILLPCQRLEYGTARAAPGHPRTNGFYIYIYIYMYICRDIYICMYIYIYIYLFMCMYIYICMYVWKMLSYAHLDTCSGKEEKHNNSFLH